MEGQKKKRMTLREAARYCAFDMIERMNVYALWNDETYDKEREALTVIFGKDYVKERKQMCN